MARNAAKKTADKPNTPTAREMLRRFVDRIVRLEGEKKDLSDDIKSVYAEGKAAGFDPKAMRQIVKESMKTQSEKARQREVEELVDLYRAALGMLDGTPLGEAARKRWEEKVSRPPRPDDGNDDEKRDDGDWDAADPAAPEAPAVITDEEARAQGRSDYAAGKKITENPFPAGTSQRAAWDEGYCDASGSDGMDLPDAWKPKGKDKSKKPDDDAGDDAGDDDGDV